jgi:DNA-binding response OmpR family regulator
MASVLIVEDDADTIQLLRQFLTSMGHTPLHFIKPRNAELALETVKPDMALIDVNLPGREHGVQFGWRLRQEWPDIPIVIMSADLSKWDKADIRDCGADEVVEKPFDLGKLRKLVQRLLKKGRPERAEDAAESHGRCSAD